MANLGPGGPRAGSALATSKGCLLAVTGGLQCGFAARDRLDTPYQSARFLGWGLARGVRLWLDVRPNESAASDWPAYGVANPGAAMTENPKEANVYAVYSLEAGALVGALLGEPRGLGIVPNGPLLELDAPETSVGLATALREMAARDGWDGDAPPDKVAVPTVVMAIRPPEAIPAEAAYVTHGGVRTTTWGVAAQLHKLDALAKTKYRLELSKRFAGFVDDRGSPKRQAGAGEHGQGPRLYFSESDGGAAKVGMLDDDLAERYAPGCDDPERDLWRP